MIIYMKNPLRSLASFTIKGIALASFIISNYDRYYKNHHNPNPTKKRQKSLRKLGQDLVNLDLTLFVYQQVDNMQGGYSLNMNRKRNQESTLNSQEGNKRAQRFMPQTVTQNFFNVSDMEQDHREQPRPMSQSGKSSMRTPRKRKSEIKLQPMRQNQRIEIFNNLTESRVPNFDNLFFTPQPASSKMSQEKQKQSQLQKSDRKRPSRRRNHLTNPLPIDQTKTQDFNAFQQQTPKVDIKKQAKAQIMLFFHEQKQQQLQPQSNKQIKLPKQDNSDVTFTLPKNNLLNYFNEHDQDDIVERQKPINEEKNKIESVLTGAQYFDFVEKINFVKQMNAEVKPATTLAMEVVRMNEGTNRLWPQFFVYFPDNGKYVVSAKKTSTRPTSTFSLSYNKSNYQENNPCYFGKIKSVSISGQIYNIFGPGFSPSDAKQRGIVPRQLLATVVYHSNIIGTQAPRKFTVFVKNPQVRYYSSFKQVQMYGEQIPLSKLCLYQQNKDKIKIFQNRKPMWSTTSQGYVLNFRGKGGPPSVKNFILQDPTDGREIVLFARKKDNRYAFQVSTFISPIVAFSVCLTTFDSRLFIE